MGRCRHAGHRLVTEAIHQHGSLAAIELAFNGMHAPNRFSRLPPMAPSHAVSDNLEPVQARAMDLADIRDLRRWHRDAALRARRAGYDIVYVYAGHAYANAASLAVAGPQPAHRRLWRLGQEPCAADP